MMFKLEYFVNGQRMEQPFDKPEIVIGRDASADFVLADSTVSRKHAVISMGRSGARMRVLSRGGMTALNGKQVSGDVQLTDGCQLHFGQLAFTFRASQQVVSPVWDPGQQSETGGQPAPEKRSAAPSVFKDENTGGIRSWDDIAAAADDNDIESDQNDDIASNFQKLQAASDKAEEGAKGTSPVLVVIGILAVVGVLILTFYEEPKAAAIVTQSEEERPIIEWKEGEIVCTLPADCQEKAIRLYKVAVETFEQREVDIVNLYASYRNMDHAEKLLERGDITTAVPEMKGITELKAKALKLMERKFIVARQDYHRHTQRSDHRKMAGVLEQVQSYFPDKRSKYYRWATIQERSMRDKGIYLKPDNL